MSKANYLSNDMREILILEIQTRPCLWDDTHTQYKNVEKNKKIWSEIGKLIGISGMYPYFLKNYRH